MNAKSPATDTIATKPAKPAREDDLRHPLHRLTAFYDAGSLELLTEHDDSGMLAARGLVDGSPVVALCSDPPGMGGAMGGLGCNAGLVACGPPIQDGDPIVGSGPPGAR